MSTPWYDSPVWQGFKWTPSDTKAHSGIDLGMPVGTPITAPLPGTLLSEGIQPWGGQVNELVIAGGKPEVLSWLHLSSLTPLAPGSPITPGEVLGKSGTPPAGYGSGAHTHFELTAGSKAPYMQYNPWHPTSSSHPLDPTPLIDSLKANGVSASGSPVTQGVTTGFSLNPADWVNAIKTGFTDAFQRIGLVFFGGFLVLVGVVVLFFSSGMAQQTAQTGSEAAVAA